MLHKALLCLLMASMVAASVISDIGRQNVNKTSTEQGLTSTSEGYRQVLEPGQTDVGSVILHSFQETLQSIKTTVQDKVVKIHSATTDFVTTIFGRPN